MQSAVIIGAGPAGSVAAVFLARAGCEVTLIEQHRFPRDKVCGECLSSLGMDVLARHGLQGRLQSAGAVELTHALLHGPGGGPALLHLPRAMWGISRECLDATLLDAAGDAGARLLQPWRCESVSPGRRPGVVVRGLEGNRVRELFADWILIADGKGALFSQRPAATGDFAIKAHFRGIDADDHGIELFGVRGHYGGLSPIEGHRWNAAFSVPAKMLEQCHGDIDALFAYLLRQNRTLAARFAGAARIGRWLASPLPRFGVADEWPERVIPLGNAAAALEPIGGEGMGLAMRSAEMVAGWLIDGGNEAGEMRRQLARLWRVRSAACRVVALAMSSGAAARLTVQLAADGEALHPLALMAMGKGWGKAL